MALNFTKETNLRDPNLKFVRTGLPDNFEQEAKKIFDYKNPYETDKNGSIHHTNTTIDARQDLATMTLPGRADLDRLFDQAASGYSLKLVDHPIEIGPVKTPIIDGTQWAKKINDHLASISEIIPNMPMIMCVMATVGGGKSTILHSLLPAYAHPDCFKQVRIYSSSMGQDPITLTMLAHRHPEVDIECHETPDFAFIYSKSEEVRKHYAAQTAAAQRGLNTEKKQKQSSKWAKYLRPYDSIIHPYQNDDGSHHGRDPHVPKYNNYWPNRPKLLSLIQNDDYFKSLPAAVNESGLTSLQKHFTTSKDFKEERMAAIDWTDKHPMQPVVEINLSRQNTIERQDKALLGKNMRMNPHTHKAVHEPTPCLFIFEDCAYMFHGSGGTRFNAWLSTIRHSHCAVIFIFQQKTSIPRFLRTVATHAIIMRCNNGLELQSLEDEWGGTVTDFLGKYHAATSCYPGRERDFLFIDLRKENKAYRSFYGELTTTDIETANKEVKQLQKDIPKEPTLTTKHRKLKK